MRISDWSSDVCSSDLAFVLVLAVTDPDAPIQQRMSMFIVPRENPGLKTLRDSEHMLERAEQDEATEGYLHYDDVRVPLDHMLGGEGMRSEERRVGKEGVSTGRSRGSAYP